MCHSAFLYLPQCDITGRKSIVFTSMNLRSWKHLVIGQHTCNITQSIFWFWLKPFLIITCLQVMATIKQTAASWKILTKRQSAGHTISWWNKGHLHNLFGMPRLARTRWRIMCRWRDHNLTELNFTPSPGYWHAIPALVGQSHRKTDWLLLPHLPNWLHIPCGCVPAG